jgi:WD40 repeat protein
VGASSGGQGAAIKLISENQCDTITSMQTHPSITGFVVGGHSGTIQMWNYISKTLMSSRKFEEEIAVQSISTKSGKTISSTELQTKKISSLAYNSTGSILAVGFSTGGIKLLNGDTLADHHENLSTTNAPPQPAFPYESDYTRNEKTVVGRASISISQHSIISLTFSKCGKYLAVADEGSGVSLIKLEPISEREVEEEGEPCRKQVALSKSMSTGTAGKLMQKFVKQSEAAASSKQIKSKHVKQQWVFYGRNKAHFERVVGLMFIDEGEGKTARLISVGYDRHICEYDVEEASIAHGFNLKV